MKRETENQIRLIRAKDAYEIALQSANDARKNLAELNASVSRLKEKYNALFILVEHEEKKRILSDYRHTTN